MENAKTYTKYGTIVCDVNAYLAQDIVIFLHSKGFSTLVDGDENSNFVITIFNDK
jgi:hypothetical protein